MTLRAGAAPNLKDLPKTHGVLVGNLPKRETSLASNGLFALEGLSFSTGLHDRWTGSWPDSRNYAIQVNGMGCYRPSNNFRFAVDSRPGTSYSLARSSTVTTTHSFEFINVR